MTDTFKKIAIAGVAALTLGATAAATTIQCRRPGLPPRILRGWLRTRWLPIAAGSGVAEPRSASDWRPECSRPGAAYNYYHRPYGYGYGGGYYGRPYGY